MDPPRDFCPPQINHHVEIAHIVLQQQQEKQQVCDMVTVAY
jgi:hypothetical protein